MREVQGEGEIMTTKSKSTKTNTTKEATEASFRTDELMSNPERAAVLAWLEDQTREHRKLATEHYKLALRSEHTADAFTHAARVIIDGYHHDFLPEPGK